MSPGWIRIKFNLDCCRNLLGLFSLFLLIGLGAAFLPACTGIYAGLNAWITTEIYLEYRLGENLIITVCSGIE